MNFIQCLYPTVNLGQTGLYQNAPMNLEKVNLFYKEMHTEDFTEPKPKIVFQFDTLISQWMFETEEQQKEVWDRLVKFDILD